MKGIYKYSHNKLLLFLQFIMMSSSYADVDWVSVTFDNDVFVGNDSGYSNGLYISTYDVSNNSSHLPSSDFWVKPLMWSIPESTGRTSINSYTFGQMLNTPSDITVEVPDNTELPYSALLFLTNSYISITAEFADQIRTTVGVVGPLALGEESQTFVHRVTQSDEPLGWDSQLKDELVFGFTRARIWRTWVSSSGNTDVLTLGEVSVGTLQSKLSTGLILRHGTGLISSYATPLFNNSRTANPAALGGGWYFYSGIQAGYTFNQIFTDGNTFRDSRSISYDRENIGVVLGVAYSWRNYSFTFAINNRNVIQRSDNNDALENLTQYGTITFSWRQ